MNRSSCAHHGRSGPAGWRIASICSWRGVQPAQHLGRVAAEHPNSKHQQHHAQPASGPSATGAAAGTRPWRQPRGCTAWPEIRARGRRAGFRVWLPARWLAWACSASPRPRRGAPPTRDLPCATSLPHRRRPGFGPGADRPGDCLYLAPASAGRHLRRAPLEFGQFMAPAVSAAAPTPRRACPRSADYRTTFTFRIQPGIHF